MTILRPNSRGSDGFTLIEVVLAIVIAVGLLTGVLVFYRQASILREEILRKADALSAVRLVMDRISGELRTVPPATPGTAILVGDSHSMRILHTAVPSKTPWRGGPLGRATIAEADWMEVAYRWSNSTNQPGLFRQERAHTASPPVSTGLPSEIESPSGGGTNSIAPSGGMLLSESIGYLRFRYWDGSRWLSGWDKIEPPGAVEVSLGIDPIEEDSLDEATTTNDEPTEYSSEVFRRIIALPAAVPGSIPEAEPVMEEEVPLP
jgi:prepilin-type N-terminal cleavage/methylation domain-containing protein